MTAQEKSYRLMIAVIAADVFSRAFKKIEEDKT